jgi:1-deoxy-D-xylulose-5-phosphate synthase
MKALLVPGMLFEELGFAYIGVVDGHDMHALRESIRQAIDTRRPVVVHVKTVKGKGYEPAEARPDTFHGTGPFHLGNGARKAAAVSGATYTDAFGQALVRLAERDERVVAITAAMTQGTGLEAFERRFPDRFYDVGIAEEHAAVFAAGLAIGGMRPVVALYSTFLQRAFDMLVQDIGLQHLPVVFAVDRAGLVGDDGPTHHGAFDLSFLRVIPGMTVMAPSSQEELQRMLATALTCDGPAALRYPRGMAAPFTPPEEISPVEVGRGVVLEEGGDVALVGIGTGVGIAREAAAILASQGAAPTLVDARFVKPLDVQLLTRLAAGHRRIVTVEENALAGGFGSAVLEAVGGAVEVVRFGLPDAFVPHGERTRVLADIGLTPQAVALAAGALSPALTRAK